MVCLVCLLMWCRMLMVVVWCLLLLKVVLRCSWCWLGVVLVIVLRFLVV